MDTSTLKRLTERLDRVERETRRWRTLGIFATLALVPLLGGAWSGAFPGPEILQARRFVLAGESGQTLAVLEKDAAGPALKFFDPSGAKVLARFGLEGRAPALRLGGASWDPRDWRDALRDADTLSALERPRDPPRAR